MVTKRHTYGLIYKISRNFFVFMAFLFVVLGLFLIVLFIAKLMSGIEFNSNFIVSTLGNILSFAVLAPIFYLFIAHLMTDISIDNNGMSVQFLWKTYQIRWAEVVEIRPSRPFGLLTNKRLTEVIVKTKLTVFHRVYGMLYGVTNQPVILIYRTISDYDLLIKDISLHAKNNPARPTL